MRACTANNNCIHEKISLANPPLYLHGAVSGKEQYYYFIILDDFTDGDPNNYKLAD
jgi:hypothetical protein